MADGTEAVTEAAAAAEQQAMREIAAGAAADDPSPKSPAAPAEEAAPTQAGEGEAKPKPLGRVTAADAKRAAIASRFSKDRPQGLDFHGDYRDPAQSYGRYGQPQTEEIEPGPLARELAPEAEAQAAEPAPPSDQPPHTGETSPEPALAPEVPQPRLLKLKVNGVEMLIPEEAVVAEAPK